MRVGLEDNLWLEKGVLATNAQAVPITAVSPMLLSPPCRASMVVPKPIAVVADARKTATPVVVRTRPSEPGPSRR